MLFSTRNDDFESEKERNFYYKFFAGYFFNELLPDVDSRLESFCSLLDNCTRGGRHISTTKFELTPECTHVSFDNHAYLFTDLGADRGEFADILLHDRSTETLVAIEAKVHSDWSYEKDILSNEARLTLIQGEIPNTKIETCLLVTRAKWDASARFDKDEHSNFQRMMKDENCRTRVIFWEELIDLVQDYRVKDHFNTQLTRATQGFGFKFKDGWFVQDFEE